MRTTTFQYNRFHINIIPILVIPLDVDALASTQCFVENEYIVKESMSYLIIANINILRKLKNNLSFSCSAFVLDFILQIFWHVF